MGGMGGSGDGRADGPRPIVGSGPGAFAATMTAHCCQATKPGPDCVSTQAGAAGRRRAAHRLSGTRKKIGGTLVETAVLILKEVKMPVIVEKGPTKKSISTTPGMSLAEVMLAACEQLGADPARCVLR